MTAWGKKSSMLRVRIQNQQALQNWGQLIFTYSSASDKVHVDFVRVHKPDGHIVTAGPDAVQDLNSPVEQVAPVYTDIRQTHVTVPDLSIGDTLEYQLHTDTVHPLVPGQFFMSWNSSKQVIALDDSFQVDVPRSREIQVKTANGVADPEIHDQGDRRTYTWHSSLTELPDDSSNSDEKKKKKKPQEFPDVQVSTFTNWQQVGDWYSAIEKPRAAVTGAIEAKAAELVNGQTTELAKAEAIYDYVTKNIRYVSLSFGVGRYQPHAAAEVLANQYGDCKDKGTLFDALLSAEHIESYPVLINSDRKIDPDIPSPGQFDHLINIVVLNGKSYWADTTPGVAPFNFILPQLWDKQALAIPPTAKSSLVRTPENPPFMPVEIVNIDGKIDALGRLQGKFSFSVTGENAVIFRSALRLVPQAYWSKISDGVVSALLGSEAKVSDFHFDDPADLDQPVKYESQFFDPNFLDLSKKDAALALPSTGIDLPEVAEPDKDDTDPLKLNFVGDETLSWKIQLPSQLTATLPLPVHMTRDYADYQSSYTAAGDAVTIERHFLLRKAEIPPDRFDDFQAFRNTVIDDEKQTLTFANSSPTSGSVPSGMSADDLYQAGVDAANRRNWPQAVRFYEAAAVKDPDHEGLWNALGRAYIMLQQYNRAIPALEKAIAKNAYDPFAYNNLGLSYAGLGRYDDAIKQYQKQIEINPLDQYAHGNLASIYQMQKKYALAQKEYQTALKITPKAFALNIGLGNADLGLHQDDAALEAFQKVLEKIPSPVTWNDVAYYLADNGSHLDLAEQYSRNSIRTIEAQLDAASLDTVGPVQAGLAVSLSAYWDTMGWIKFKQGDMKAAEAYIHAAWMIEDASDMGDHLGQIYEKEGRRADAIHTYALTLDCLEPPLETRGRLAALIGDAKVGAEKNSARPDLAARRSLKLPNPQEIDATAEYWILLSPGSQPNTSSVEAAKFIAVDDDYEKPAIGNSAGTKSSVGNSQVDTTKSNGTSDAKLQAALAANATSLRAAKFPYFFPAGEATKIVLRGVLACSNITNSCTFTPFSADQTYRTTVASSGSVLAQ
jgi:tetratricopeptide (TPR) repeat protein